MGYEDGGYDQQKLQYETGETRPVNPPSMIGGQTLEISDTTTYPISQIIAIQNWPEVEYSLWLEDAAGNNLKSILSATTGDESATTFGFDYSDYADAVTNYSLFEPLPQAQSFSGFFVSEIDSTSEQKRVPVTFAPDTACYPTFSLTPVEVVQMETFPYLVDAEDFVSDAGGMTDFELSADDGDTWSTSYTITDAPTMDEHVPFLVRALGPCASDGVATYFVRLGPS
jgi:hypothetical protein